jgi:hypothetical protein
MSKHKNGYWSDPFAGRGAAAAQAQAKRLQQTQLDQALEILLAHCSSTAGQAIILEVLNIEQTPQIHKRTAKTQKNRLTEEVARLIDPKKV